MTTRIKAYSSRRAKQADDALLAEIDRLEDVFSAFRPTSELSRWKRGDVTTVSSELLALLQTAAFWQEASCGAFNPAVGGLIERWKQAELDGILPTPDEVLDLADAIRMPPYSADAQRVGRCDTLNFNAIAKGMIVDMATAHVMGDGVEDILVNIGGDLLHSGPDPILVGVEDPKRAYDNVAPLTAVEVQGQGMATSGLARRGYRIGGRWLSHVIDPRTGWPVEEVSSASVIARDATTADVVATVLSVLTPTAGLEWLFALRPLGPQGQTFGPIACCVIDQAGNLHTNSTWMAASRATDTSAQPPTPRRLRR